jgi:hypothetical protein
MKYTQTIGIVAAFLLIMMCFLPWVTIVEFNITLSGTNGYVREGLTFGKQIIAHSVYAIIAVIFFLLPYVWAKRVNLFVTFLNLSWAIKNYIIFTICRQGICPDKKPAIYLLVFFALVMLIASMLPKINLKK